MRRLWRLFSPEKATLPDSEIETIRRLRNEYASLSDPELRAVAARWDNQLSTIAVTAVVAARVLGQEMFDTQWRGALGLVEGRIVEMATGEGKTLAAVPAIAWLAREHAGVHVMTANDYLARRDADWMGEIYRRLGLTVGFVQQSMAAEARRNAYAQDITYATANEVGFDFLRDQVALRPEDQVHRAAFHAAVIDEADSALIDEARIPLVIAAGDREGSALAYTVDQVVRGLRRGVHYFTDTSYRNTGLTDSGIRIVEHSLGCGNLFGEENLRLHTAVQDALHAHALLRRDVDYLVRNDAIETIDEHKGRIAQDRRWPAGLHTAVEAKEGVATRPQGCILGSITVENLVAMYPHLCGMTGTAATQATEFREIYGLAVEQIPTHKPVIRVDHPDRTFRTRHEKLHAAAAEIRQQHAAGRPVLVGTASVEESERLSAVLRDVPHQVLNARDDHAEAAIIARAGERGAVTISTNMAGRGVDIRLGQGVAELGGLLVIGTNKHASRRIDNQLRGRAGRQGDPGESRFFVSFEDDLMARNADADPRLTRDPMAMQRFVEGQNLDTRLMLSKYEAVIEGQRQRIQAKRQAILTGETSSESAMEQVATLRAMDDAWSDHLAAVADLRSGVQWLSFGGRVPLHEYLQKVDEWFRDMEQRLPEEIEARIQAAQAGELDPNERGAVWTYLTTDEPFGALSERILRGLARKARKREVWG